jgi:hypothetical protein
MELRGLAADVGTAASAAVVLLAALPYAIGRPSAVEAYYAAGIVGPQYFGIAAAVTAVVFRAGRTGRTDPATAAGTTLAFGGVLALLALVWAVSPPPSVVGGVTTAAWFDYHRWILAVAALLVPAAAGGYARHVLE